MLCSTFLFFFHGNSSFLPPYQYATKSATNKQCAPADPVITVNKFNTRMCCCTYANQIHKSSLAISLSLPLIHFFSYVCLLHFWDVRNSSFFQGILWSFAPSLHHPHPSPLSAPYHIQRSAAFLFPTPLPPFFFPSALSSPSPTISPSHLSDLNTCIMHGEGKAVRRPITPQSKQDSGGKEKKKTSPAQQYFSKKTNKQTNAT